MRLLVDCKIESKKVLTRLLSEIDLSDLPKAEQKPFAQRLTTHFPALFELMIEVYGERYDFYFYLQQLVLVLKDSFSRRTPFLKKKDQQRAKGPNWYVDQNMMGMACYVDLFAGDIKKLQAKIPYLLSIGVTYLHLMPLYKSPENNSDGGYAVSDYRNVDTNLGNMKDLEALAKALSKAGINLVLDFVFNHTSNEHEWAERAKEGAQEYQDYYWMFDNKEIPNQYEQNLREIFPQVRRGNFTHSVEANKWVWTTFNSFQWDLNYANPAVFNAMAAEMLFLANIGCDALRLDALAFVWKEMGTSCENQPKAHALIQAFNRCLKIVAPSVVFKSEAIVHPDEVLKYIDKDECELSYNPLLMALLWNSLATRKTNLLTASMQKSFAISQDCVWVNYARCHDDIGWTFDDEVANNLGINSHDHRRFLNQFYTGRFEGSFAKGVAFAENPADGDCRVCGSLASLAGLEQGLEKNDDGLIENAVKRILLIHSVILSIGGIPLLYSGDEVGLLNDYEYQNDPSKLYDDRWVHRIALNEELVKRSESKGSPFFDIAQGLKKMIQLRKSNEIFGSAITHILQTENSHIFAFKRILQDLKSNTKIFTAIFNFSESEQVIETCHLALPDTSNAVDIISKTAYQHLPRNLQLLPYQVMWLMTETE